MKLSNETFQIPLSVAEIYEVKFVPAIFQEWAGPLLDAAGVGPGSRVLDVACGTGIVARTAADRVTPGGSVAGVDLNRAMLTVAERILPEIEWRLGDAGDLPFADGSFDVVVCQMALMFFPDRRKALEEMSRVVVSDGAVAVVVPAAIGAQPAYQKFVDIAAEHAGPEALSLLGTYWSCGDLDAIVALMGAAGLEVTDRRTRVGTARFSSSNDFVTTEVEGSPLVDRITAAEYERIQRDVASALSGFTTAAGRFEVPLVGHIVTARARH